jgi:hypothetical protein
MPHSVATCAPSVKYFLDKDLYHILVVHKLSDVCVICLHGKSLYDVSIMHQVAVVIMYIGYFLYHSAPAQTEIALIEIIVVFRIVRNIPPLYSYLQNLIGDNGSNNS